MNLLNSLTLLTYLGCSCNLSANLLFRYTLSINLCDLLNLYANLCKFVDFAQFVQGGHFRNHVEHNPHVRRPQERYIFRYIIYVYE